PVESYVNDGIVLQQTTSVAGNYATKNSFGWDNAGHVVTGKMTETTTVLQLISADGKKTETFNIDKLNAAPSDGEVAVYTNGGTYTVSGAGKYTVKIDEGSIASSYPCYGTSQRTSTGDIINDKSVTVKSGNFAIVVKGDNEKSRWLYDNLTYGAKANLVKAPAGNFAGMSYVVGGWNVLINNGTVNTNCLHGSQTDANSNADRTFFGIKEDGTMMLCALDGRQTGTAVGMTVNNEAQLAKDLGLKTAIELDGGGSTTFVLRLSDELKVVNHSSEMGASTDPSKCRSVLNAVLLVEKAEESETPVKPDPVKPDPIKPDPVEPDPVKPDPIEPDPSTSGDEGKQEEPKG
ncbi:MAG: phosphodiester glycosidase family protein, partial [Clostridiales bacterium]|nr:phosphodiester glycosidase family protein [Clostridiales bacterium]